MRLRISTCEWVFGSRPLPFVAQAVKDAGIDGIHLRGDAGGRDLREIRAILEPEGLAVRGVTPTIVWPRDNADLSNPDPIARRRAIDYYRGLIDLAREVGSPSIGIVPAAEGRLAPIEDPDREWSLAVESVRALARYAHDSGVIIGIEPLNRYETYLVNRVSDALRFVDEVSSRGVGVIVDAFHMSIEEADPASAVREVGELLLEVQLADSNRLAPGSGHLDVQAIVSAAQESEFGGLWVMEFVAPGSRAEQPADDDAAMRALQADLREAIGSLEAMTIGPSGTD